MPARFRDRLPCASSNQRPSALPPPSEKFGRRLIPPFPSQSRCKSMRPGRTPEQDHGPFDLCSHHGDVAGMITRRFLLFVGGFVFLIDHDETEIFQGRENGTAGADHDTGATRMNLVPFIMALAFG